MARTRSAALAFAVAAPALAALSLPTLAMAAPTGWSATLRDALPQPRHEIVNSVVWSCNGTQCTAPAQDSRPAIVCRKVVQKFGPLTRFTSPAGELDADALAKCNG